MMLLWIVLFYLADCKSKRKLFLKLFSFSSFIFFLEENRWSSALQALWR